MRQAQGGLGDCAAGLAFCWATAFGRAELRAFAGGRTGPQAESEWVVARQARRFACAGRRLRAEGRHWPRAATHWAQPDSLNLVVLAPLLPSAGAALPMLGQDQGLIAFCQAMLADRKSGFHPATSAARWQHRLRLPAGEARPIALCERRHPYLTCTPTYLRPRTTTHPLPPHCPIGARRHPRTGRVQAALPSGTKPLVNTSSRERSRDKSTGNISSVASCMGTISPPAVETW